MGTILDSIIDEAFSTSLPNKKNYKKNKRQTLTKESGKLVRESKYLVYHSVNLPNRKTPILFICNKSNEELGHIRFYPQWRRFVFYPKADTLFDSNCLEDIIFTINLIQQMWINKEEFK